jgi:hypothetical protein
LTFNPNANKRQENTEGAIKNGQARETGNIGYTRRRKTQHNMCWTPLYASKHTTGGKDEPNIISMRKS